MSINEPFVDQYKGLQDYLTGLPKEQYYTELTFDKIEELIGSPLPAEAYEYIWWHFDEKAESTPQTQAFVAAGFGVSLFSHITRTTRRVSFTRGLQRWANLYVSSSEFGNLPAVERLQKLAFSYLESGKILCSHLGENPAELNWQRASVVCFCHRHAIELFVKSCILCREPIEKCDHKISKLLQQYFKLFPGDDFYINTTYEISIDDIELQFGKNCLNIEDFERNDDQVFRYFSDKVGRPPKTIHMFGPGCWLSMIERLQGDMERIRGLISQ